MQSDVDNYNQASSSIMTISQRDLYGAWTLASWMVAEQEHEQFQPFWLGVRGQLIYTPDGQMSAILIHPGWESTGIAPDRGFREGVIAYGGLYTVASACIQHHIQQTNIRVWIGQTLIRQACLQYGSLILTTPITQDTQGESAIHRLTWVRPDLNR
jgi:hypothetical protein